MKTLLILRHAKSSWDDPTLDDFDRPLAPRGIRAAKVMGDFLRREKLLPDRVLCSDAVRARETYDLLSAAWRREIEVAFDHDLYLAAPADTLRRIAALPDGSERAMIIGHNPGLHQLAIRLIFDGNAEAMERLGGNLPTAALAEIVLRGETWRAIEPTTGRLLRFIRPKDLK